MSEETGKKCKISCRECTSCNKLCPDFVDKPCPVKKKAPYVCNACPKSRTCLFDKYLYNAEYAHRAYVNMLHSSRKGIDLTKDELISLDELVTPLVKRGRSISHIMTSHEDEIPCCSRTLYSYINKGYLSVKNIDMRRTVRYKKRIRKQEAKPSPRKKYGHLYKDFPKRLEEDPSQRVVEMDTVEGEKGGKVLQTILWRQEKLILAFLLDQKDQQSAVGTLDHLERSLGKEVFRVLFPVILTDNGVDFSNPDLFEYSKDGSRRTELYYCDPRRSDQKGGIEKNHEYIRYILPKGTSFDDLTQEKIQLMMNHINSACRSALKGRCPTELALEHFGEEAVKRLGLRLVEPDEVNLTRALLK